MCIEYNECHYNGIHNINVKRIFVINGHYSGGSSFVYVNDFCYYINCAYECRCQL